MVVIVWGICTEEMAFCYDNTNIFQQGQSEAYKHAVLHPYQNLGSVLSGGIILPRHFILTSLSLLLSNGSILVNNFGYYG